MTSTDHQKLGAFLWQVTDFILSHRGRRCLPEATREPLFRYVALCHLTGRLNIALTADNKIEAVLFFWADWREHIEAKAAEGLQQFESCVHKGDSIFVAEVIGARSGVRRIYQAAVEQFPHLVVTPIFTYRAGKLVRLSWQEIERFMEGKQKC
jgi:hypothetical protein